MIDISNYKEILIKDVNMSTFKLSVSAQPHSKIYDWDLDARDFVEGGKLSTGNIIIDIILYINSKFSELEKKIKTKKVEPKDFDKLDYSEFANKYNDTVYIHNLCYENSFEKLHGVGAKFFWLKAFLKVSENGAVNQKAPNGDKFTFEKDVINVSMVYLLEMLVRVFMYTQSQSYRDILTANTCYNIVCCSYGPYQGIAKYSNVYIYDNLLGDYVSIDKNNSVISKGIYPLSKSNYSKSSDYREMISRVDSLNNLDELKKDMVSDVSVLTTMPRFITQQNKDEFYYHIFAVNAYRRVANDCMVSCTLLTRYKEVKDDSRNYFLTKLFYDVEKSVTKVISKLYSLYKDSPIVQYKNLVFDKEIDEIISHPMIELELTYSTYTKSGGARRYGYNTLKDKKITPVKRRDALYNACCDICDIAFIDKTKLFSKLDVDFKRFYSHV